MRRLIVTLIFSALMPTVATSAEPPPDDCSGGIYSVNPPPQRPAADIDAFFLPLVRLGTERTLPASPADGPPFVTSGSVPFFPIDGRNEQLREAWYVARSPFPGSVPVFRDEDSFAPTTEILGYAWKMRNPGMTLMARYRASPTFPHRDLEHLLESPADQENARPRQYAYRRFWLDLDRCSVLADAYRMAIESPSLRVDFNAVWGNAVGRITFRSPYGDRQILVDDDIGALAQAALWHGLPEDDPGTCCRVNPTEAGGADPWNYANTARWSGSPILAIRESVDEEPNPYVETTVRPMNFMHAPFHGTDGARPLLWRGTFTKRTRVYDDVLEMRFSARLDEEPERPDDAVYNMNQVFWLRADAWGNPENVLLTEIDLATGSESTVPLPSYLGHRSFPFAPAHAVILSTPDGSFAAGIIRGHASSAAIEYRLGRWCSTTVVNGACPSKHSIFVLDTFAFHRLRADADEYETIYLAVGTGVRVRERLRLACTLLGLGCPP